MHVYGVGDLVEFVASTRARTILSPGCRGSVARLDPNGIIWVDWSTGALLPMVPEIDVLYGVAQL